MYKRIIPSSEMLVNLQRHVALRRKCNLFLKNNINVSSASFNNNNNNNINNNNQKNYYCTFFHNDNNMKQHNNICNNKINKHNYISKFTIGNGLNYFSMNLFQNNHHPHTHRYFSTTKNDKNDDDEKNTEDDIEEDDDDEEDEEQDDSDINETVPPPPSLDDDIYGDLPSNLILDEGGFDDILPEEEPEIWADEIKKVQITKFLAPDTVVEEIVLDNEIFGKPIRVDILQRVVQWQLAKRRKGLAKTKNRGEVSGGGKKPHKQKGTGRARAGSTRAPHWRGGGRIHGPRGNRDWSYKLNKKVRRLGLKTALSAKYRETKFAMVENLKLESHKTKNAFEALKARGWHEEDEKILFIHGNDEDVDYATLALNNIPHVQMLPSRGANVYSVLYADIIVLTKDSLVGLTERLIKDKKPNPVFLNIADEDRHTDNSKFKEHEKMKGKSTRERHQGRRGWIKKQKEAGLM